jgi:TonB family protein
MKLILFVAMWLALTASCYVKAKTVYADVQVTNLPTKGDFYWEQANKNTPKYPIELARTGITGCAVLSFDISEGGETKNVAVVNSYPKKSIGKYSRKMLKKWKWVPTSTKASSTSEKRMIRLDYCLGGQSVAESQTFCKQQAQVVCS